MFYERNLTVEMNIAQLVNRYSLMSCDDVRTAGGKYVNCGDRKLRYLASTYRIRRHKEGHPDPIAYEYWDKYYYFKRDFQRFCGVWLREQIRKQNKKNERSAA